MKRDNLIKHSKTYALMIILTLAIPIVVGVYAMIGGNWVYAATFALLSIVNLDLFYYSNKKMMPYTFRLLVKLESKIYKEPYDPRLEEE
jgi:P2-related tail formation protein